MAEAMCKTSRTDWAVAHGSREGCPYGQLPEDGRYTWTVGECDLGFPEGGQICTSKGVAVGAVTEG